MTTVLAGALRALELELGPGSAGAILRTEVDDESALALTVAACSGPRWFEYRCETLRELRPAGEQRIPAVPALMHLGGSGAVEVLSWRPGRRLVARVSDNAGVRVVKAHRRGRAAPAARRHTAVAAAVQGVVRLPRLLGADVASESVAYEVVRGTEARYDDSATFSRIGALLAALQRAPLPIGLDVHGRAQELAQLDRHARRFASVAGDLPRGWREARALLDVLTDLAPGEHVLAHRDLHEGQFLVEGAHLTLLDLDLACLAERELDLANLIVHVRLAGWLGLRGADARRTQAAERALLDACGTLDERRFGFYSAASSLRLALVHGLRPRAAAAVGPLVELARDSAAEACRA